MTLQTRAPLEHTSLNPSFMPAAELVGRVEHGELTLDPPYQRGPVWTLDQRMALVQTWLRGLPAGVVILADRCNPAWSAAHPERNPDTTEGEPQWACVDGKQRITTAVMWFRGDFAVPASWLPADHTKTAEDTADGPYVRHTHLTPKGRRIFERRAALLIATSRDCATLADEASFYLLVNGGAPQAQGDLDRAAAVAAGR